MMWVRSFISRFKKAILFIVVVIVITGIMNYLYVDDTDEFSRYTLHALYEEEENIDRLYLGSSHVFCGIDPVILDGINSYNNFNLATPMQQLNTSYYLLKEADKKHHIDRVYLDLYYQCTVEGAGYIHDHNMFPYSWNVMNQMKPSFNKLCYMLDLSDPEYYYMTFLAFTRYKEELFDLDHIAKVVKGKQTDAWKNYEYRHTTMIGDKEYVIKNGEKGFRIFYGTPEEGGFYGTNPDEPLKENPMTEASLEYLQKIVAYCEEKDIALTWINCPMDEFQLVRDGGYDNYVRQVSKLAEEYQIPYYDFNLCKREYLDVSPNKYWSDQGHLNTDGAAIFTQFLGDFLLAQETGADTYKDCFYSSYAEKTQSVKKEIYGLEISESQEYDRCMPDITEEQWEEYVIYRIRPVTNAPAGDIDIFVSAGKDAGTETNEAVPLIWDGNDTYVVFTAHEHGVMYVKAKLKDSAEITNWARIDY